MGKVALLRSFFDPIAAIFEGDSIVGSVPPAASTTSYAWRFDGAYTRNVTVSVPAQGGTNYEQMLARLTNSGAWGNPVLQQVEDMLVDVEFLYFFVMMCNGLIQHAPQELWDLVIGEYFPLVKAVNPAKVKTIAVHLMHRNTSHLPDGPPDPPPYNTAPGFEIGDGLVVNTYNDAVDLDPSRVDGILKFRLMPIAAFNQVAAATIEFNGLSEGVHTNDPTYLQMLDVALQEVNDQTARGRPIPVVDPIVSGTGQNGSTLTMTPGIWDNDGTRNKLWYRSGSPVSGQTGLTYNLGPQDVDELVKCNEDVTHIGIRVFRSSNVIGPITSNYGPEKIVNGDFATNVSGWTAAGGAIVTWDNGKMKITKPVGAFQARASQTFSTTAGSWYRVLGEYTQDVATFDGKVLVQDVSTSALLLNQSLHEGPTNNNKFQAIGANTYLDVRSGDVATDNSAGLFDNISVKEIVV